MQRVPTGRSGFSLIELLISVAIIAALVGVAVPFFSGHMREARSAKAKQDLEILSSAVQRFTFGKKPYLSGSSLKPIIGQTLQELPVDPYGNPYFFDGNLGVIGTFGSDGQQGGEGEDADFAVRYAGHIVPINAVFRSGGFGVTKQGYAIEIRLSKPVQVVTGNEGLVASDFVLALPAPVAFGAPMATFGYAYDSARSNPANGIITLSVPFPPYATVPIAEGTLVCFANIAVAVRESPAPSSETGLIDPLPYLWGPQPPLLPDGSWQGAVLAR